MNAARPGGYPTGLTTRRDGHAIVACSVCGHESIGDLFFNVISGDPRDAWWRHRLHCDAKHPVAEPDPLRDFAEFVVSLDDVAMRRSITLTRLIEKAREALDEAAVGNHCLAAQGEAPKKASA